MAEPGGPNPAGAARQEAPRQAVDRGEAQGKVPERKAPDSSGYKRQMLSPTEELIFRMRRSKRKREEAATKQYEEAIGGRESTPAERDEKLRRRIQEAAEARRSAQSETRETPRERRRRRQEEATTQPMERPATQAETPTAEERPRRQLRRYEDPREGLPSAEEPARRSSRAERRERGELRTYEAPPRPEPSLEQYFEAPQEPSLDEEIQRALPMEPEKGMRVEIPGYNDRQQIVAVEDGYVYYLDQRDFNRMDASSGAYTSPKGEANRLQKKMLVEDFYTLRRRQQRDQKNRMQRQRAAS